MASSLFACPHPTCWGLGLLNESRGCMCRVLRVGSLGGYGPQPPYPGLYSGPSPCPGRGAHCMLGCASEGASLGSSSFLWTWLGQEVTGPGRSTTRSPLGLPIPESWCYTRARSAAVGAQAPLHFLPAQLRSTVQGPVPKGAPWGSLAGSPGTEAEGQCHPRRGSRGMGGPGLTPGGPRPTGTPSQSGERLERDSPGALQSQQSPLVAQPASVSPPQP